jgi:Abnormal spindle-like microcephaly-assoc'd, ASPM-SPD-2-Hydin
MARTNSSQLLLLCTLLALASVSILTGCSGVSAGANNRVVNNLPSEGTLAVTPSSLSFGNVAVGNTASLTGTLTATGTDVTISSAAWNGSGYSVSGITFPVTVTTGQNTKYTVTFTPAAAGSASGNITFTSNATNASLKQSFSGSGQQSSQHTVALLWDASTSSVSGYNIYRGTQSGGPYSMLNSSPLSSTSYTDSGLLSGTTYYYVSTAVNSSNIESAFSNEASAAIP